MKENKNENLETTELPKSCEKSTATNCSSQSEQSVKTCATIISSERITADDCHASSHTDKFVESISLKGVAVHLAHVFNANERIFKYVFAVLCGLFGIVCVVFTAEIKSMFPWVVGSILALLGVITFIHAIIKKEYRRSCSNVTVGGLVVIAISVLIFVENEWATPFIATLWGVIGILEGAHALNLAICEVFNRKNPVYHLIRATIELVLGFMLVYHPQEHIGLHIFVFGLTLVFDAIMLVIHAKRRKNNESV